MTQRQCSPHIPGRERARFLCEAIRQLRSRTHKGLATYPNHHQRCSNRIMWSTTGKVSPTASNHSNSCQLYETATAYAPQRTPLHSFRTERVCRLSASAEFAVFRWVSVEHSWQEGKWLGNLFRERETNRCVFFIGPVQVSWSRFLFRLSCRSH